MTVPAADISPELRLRSRRGLGLAALAAASVIATSTAGRIISAAPVAGWYKTIAKPSFNPPNWAFPVAWTLLFVLMGIAFWRVLVTAPGTRRTRAISLFAAQLVTNVGWSTAFFGAHSPVLGMVVIVPFWLLILATAWAFRAVDRPAAWLLTPYLAWVAFAAVLNAAIVTLN
jgi:translocator protein